MYSQIKHFHLPDVQQACELMRIISAAESVYHPRKIDRPLALYGAGDLGRLARQFLDKLKIPIEFVIDVQAKKVRKDPFWDGVQIVSPDQVGQKDRKTILLALAVVNAPYCDIASNLHRSGWVDVIPFYDIAEAYRNWHPLTNGWFSGPLTANDVSHLNTVLLQWSDDVSRAHHIQFLAWRCIRQEWIFSLAPVTIDDRYFIPEITNRLSENEIFADIGAHIGSVSQKFIKIVNENFNKILMFEPDSINRINLETNVLEISSDLHNKIQVSSDFIGQGRRNVLFAEGYGYASRAFQLGSKLLDKVSIDDLDMSPTFIKLHIEGGELEALFGARNTITKNRPIIAVTSYHNSLGIYVLPKWLMSELTEYDFILRLHGWCGTGAVIYCIPKERPTFATSLN